MMKLKIAALLLLIAIPGCPEWCPAQTWGYGSRNGTWETVPYSYQPPPLPPPREPALPPGPVQRMEPVPLPQIPPPAWQRYNERLRQYGDDDPHDYFDPR